MVSRLTALCMLLLGSSCNNPDAWNCAKKLGELTSDERYPGLFHSVEAEGRLNVVYHVDSTHRVEVIAGANMLPDIQTSSVGGILYLSNSSSCNWVRNLEAVPLLHIYAPELRSYVNRCSGDLAFADTLVTDTLRYEQWECSGKVSLRLRAEVAQIYAHVGFTELRAEGEAVVAGLYNASNSSFDATNLVAQDCYVNNSSFQPLYCRAEGYLLAQIKSSGDIRYRGQPQLIQTDITGSGNLVNLP